MSEDNRKKHLLRGREGSEQSAEPDKSYSQYNFTCSFFQHINTYTYGEAGRELKTLLQQHVCDGRAFSFIWDPEKNPKPLICVYKTGCAAGAPVGYRMMGVYLKFLNKRKNITQQMSEKSYRNLTDFEATEISGEIRSR